MESNLTLPLIGLLETLKRSRPPKCEVWTRSYIPCGQVFKVPLDNAVFSSLLTENVDEIYLMNEDDLTDEIMEILRGANISVFDAHRNRLP